MADTRIRVGACREQCGSNERCTGSIHSLKNLTTSLVWTGGGGEAWGWVKEAGGGEGEPDNWSDLAGGERAVCGCTLIPQKPKNWFDLAGDEEGVGGRRGGGGPGRRRGSIKVQFFGLP